MLPDRLISVEIDEIVNLTILIKTVLPDKSILIGQKLLKNTKS